MQQLEVYALFTLMLSRKEVISSFVILFSKLDIGSIGSTDILDDSFGIGRTKDENSLAPMICNKLDLLPVGGIPRYESRQ